MARPSDHILAHCDSCGDMVVCSTCGNNCCNGTHGTVDGGPCPDCDEAYEDQTAFNEDPECVRFAKDLRDQPLSDVIAAVQLKRPL